MRRRKTGSKASSLWRPARKWSIPDRPNAKDNEKNFCSYGEAIWEGYDLRKASRVLLPPYDNAESYLKRQCFGLIYNYSLKLNDRRMVRNLVNRYADAPESDELRKNFYYWGLVAIYALRNVKGQEAIDKTKRKIRRDAHEMLYAQRNEIGPELLIGFINQSGCTKNIAELVRQNKKNDPSLSFVVEPLTDKEDNSQ